MATYECQVVQTRSGDIADDVLVNVLHLDHPGQAHSLANAQVAADAIEDLWVTDFDTGGGGQAIRALQSDEVSLTSIRVYAAGQTGLPIYTHVPAAPVVGAVISTPLPPQVALAITFRNAATAGPGRLGSRWGRMYLGGLTVAMLTAGARVQNLDHIALANQFHAWNVQLPTGWDHVVFSRAEGTAKPITSYVVDNVFDIIRSRRYQTHTARTITSLV